MSKSSVYFVSLGCPKNRVDTEVMLGLVNQAGYTLVDSPEKADAIVVNTCGFIGEAKEESIETILEMARYKESGGCKRLVVTGCLSQRYGEELGQELPEVDHFLGSSDMNEVVRALHGLGPREYISADPTFLYDAATPRLLSQGSYSAYVKIAEGCDRPCGFCIIPTLRGKQRSRTLNSLEQEVRELTAQGTVEVNLVAQDLTTYGTDLNPPVSLAMLLRRLGRIEQLTWIRLHYAYPTATTDELLDTIASEPKVAKYIDVPLQHINDAVLKAMRRGYTGKLVHRLLDRIRQRAPNATLRTTFIVGHPGETKAAFSELCQFVTEAEFDHVGVFTYSAEEGTTSYALPAEIGQKEMESRQRKLMRLQRQVSRKKMKRWIGRELNILVEGPSPESEYVWAGRHEGQAPEVDGAVFLSLGVDASELRPGDVVSARVTSYADYDLAAEVLAHVSRTRAQRRIALPVVASLI